MRVQMQQCPCSRAVIVSLPGAEALAFSCFTELMKRMNQNFPHGGAMDTHFANMRSLIQVRGSWRRDGSLSDQRGKAVPGTGVSEELRGAFSGGEQRAVKTAWE